MTCKIQANDTGTAIRITIQDCNNSAIDISAATNMSIIFKKPSGTTLSKDGSFYTDGTDGIITYTVPSGLFDEIGTWKIQASVTANNGSWKSNTESFKVHRNL